VSAASRALVVVVAACAAPAEVDDPALVPPLDGQAAVEAWLDAGHYQAWRCQPAAHDAIAPSPHGRVRVCANAIAAAGVARVDASLALEIVDAAGAVVGRGVQRHTRPGDDGATWYWYLRVPPTSATAHDDTGLAADGWGFEGPPRDYCAACHAQAPGLVFTVPGAAAR
jgi:hypothetical protein